MQEPGLLRPSAVEPIGPSIFKSLAQGPPNTMSPELSVVPIKLPATGVALGRPLTQSCGRLEHSETPIVFDRPSLMAAIGKPGVPPGGAEPNRGWVIIPCG